MKRIIYLVLFTTSLAGASMVDENLISTASQIPRQDSLGTEASWSCGPNALARFLVLGNLKVELDKREQFLPFMAACPKSCGQPTTTAGHLVSLALGCSGLYCVDLGWEGHSDVMLGTALIIAAFSPYAIEYVNYWQGVAKVGPTPKWLADYGNRFLQQQNLVQLDENIISAQQFDNPEQVEIFIKKQLDQGLPLIILVNYGTLAWHYENIISYKGEQFEVLGSQSEKVFKDIKYVLREMDFHRSDKVKVLKELLKHCGGPISIDIGRFNLIYFNSYIYLDGCAKY